MSEDQKTLQGNWARQSAVKPKIFEGRLLQARVIDRRIDKENGQDVSVMEFWIKPELSPELELLKKHGAVNKIESYAKAVLEFETEEGPESMLKVLDAGAIFAYAQLGIDGQRLVRKGNILSAEKKPDTQMGTLDTLENISAITDIRRNIGADQWNKDALLETFRLFGMAMSFGGAHIEGDHVEITIDLIDEFALQALLDDMQHQADDVDDDLDEDMLAPDISSHEGALDQDDIDAIEGMDGVSFTPAEDAPDDTGESFIFISCDEHNNRFAVQYEDSAGNIASNDYPLDTGGVWDAMQVIVSAGSNINAAVPDTWGKFYGIFNSLGAKDIEALVQNVVDQRYEDPRMAAAMAEFMQMTSAPSSGVN